MTRHSLVSLSLTLRRLSHEYRAWAREAEAAGDLDSYRKWTAEADKRWRDAKWHLGFARRFNRTQTA